MTWEPTNEWPDGVPDAGAYRGKAEIVVARRNGMTTADRFRLWWHSTPDHRFGDLPQDVLLTPQHLYVRRKGGEFRVRLEHLIGGRIEAGRRIYAVRDGDDLVLVDRDGDALEKALEAHVTLSEQAWVHAGSVWVPAVMMFACAWVAFYFAVESWVTGLEHIREGLMTSESALGVYATVAAIVVMMIIGMVLPTRRVVDRLGITTVRGLLRGMRHTIPVEKVSRIAVEPATYKGHPNGFRVVAVHSKGRMALIFVPRGSSLKAAKGVATAHAQVCADQLSVPLRS